MHIAQTEKQIMIVNSDDEDVNEGVDIPALSEPLPVQSTIKI